MDSEHGILVLLDEPRWNTAPLTGGRTLALLATLVLARGRPVSESLLIERLWPDRRPGNSSKALHVVVSRARQSTDAALVLRTPEGYRIGSGAQIDAVAVLTYAEDAAAAWRDGDPQGTIAAARHALAFPVGDAGEALAQDPVAELRGEAGAARQRTRRLLGMALSAAGEHEDAYDLLVAAAEAQTAEPDEPLMEHLLRSEWASRGSAAALHRYASYRDETRDRLGIDPGPALQRLHTELLAADRPVASGLRTGPELIGRDQDTQAVLSLLESSRVVTLLGTGGLGKTTLAQVVAARSRRSAVYVVELVGATTAEDVLIELAGAVGAGESLQDRMDARRWRDVRGRVSQRLARVPSLLVLDNCEHVIDAVADLVAFLVATASDLRVLTTSRTPLAISTEQVYPLAQLDPTDSVELFRRRAGAARPGAQLPEPVIQAITARLDGLPLAIELAAAKIRVMSAAQIAARLDDRFALLRSGDRAAPARHRTLEDLIEWSWSLLDSDAQHGMAWLALFPDGFTLATADTVLGAHPQAAATPLSVVESLVEQSLLAVREDADGVRYRMLETLREFALLKLDHNAERNMALTALNAWATSIAHDLFTRLAGPDQVAAMNITATEETTLVDVARSALDAGLIEVAIPVFAALTRYWTATEQFNRLAVAPLYDAVDVCADAPPALRDMARVLVGRVLFTRGIFGLDVGNAGDVLAALGPGTTDPAIAAETAFTLEMVNRTGEMAVELLQQASTSPDPHRARLAWQWTAHWRENIGDVAGAVAAVARALALTDPTALPVEAANLESTAAGMYMQLGDFAAGERHADRALATLRLLSSHHERTELHTLHTIALIDRGRFDEAEAEIADLESRIDGEPHPYPSSARAELCLARGDRVEGLRLYRDDLRRIAKSRTPTGLGGEGFEPWTLYASAVCLTAHARFGDELEDPQAQAEITQLAHQMLATARTYLDRPGEFVDYPVAGTLLFALAWWHGKGSTAPADTVARLLALADSFGYNRGRTTMRLEPAVTMTTEVTAAVEQWRTIYAGRLGPDLHAEAEAALRDLTARDAQSER